MCLTPTTPAAAFSTFLVTWVSSALGAAPVWTMVTVTIGMSMLGIWVIGRVFRLTAPSAINTTKSTNDGIGLRIDQAEMLRAISTSSRGFRVIADRHDRFARPRAGPASICTPDPDPPFPGVSGLVVSTRWWFWCWLFFVFYISFIIRL